MAVFLRRRKEKRFHLHLGVHKTGTTYTQTLLGINREKLRGDGVAFWDMEFTRHQLTPLLVGLSRENGPIPAEECLRRLKTYLSEPEVAAARKVVISDENLLGFISEIVRRNGYKGIVRRMLPMRDLLKRDVKVFLTIRSYPDFITSMYCELITTKPWFPFEKIRDGGFVAEHSWLKMYQSLVRTFGQKCVIVAEYQTIFANLEGYLALLSGSKIQFDFPEKEIRISPSANAIERIRSQQEEGVDLPLKKIVRQAMKRFPKNAENPRYDPWTSEERAMLEERYRQDISEIPLWVPRGKR